MNLTPELIHDPPGTFTDEGEDGDQPELVIMVTILEERTDEARSARIALPGNSRPSLIVDALISGIHGAAATYSSMVYSMLVDRQSAQSAPVDGALTVSLLDQLAAHGQEMHGGPPAAINIPGWPAPVPFEIARAVLVAAGAW